MLTVRDVAEDPEAASCKEVLTGQPPKLEHLRKGCFRQRAKVFASLRAEFEGWVERLRGADAETSDRIPVFWISGRSGDGKSVLLLQLVAEILERDLVGPLLRLRSGGQLLRLLEAPIPGSVFADRAIGRVFAVVDDVYDVADREEWDEQVQRACALRATPVALITCGPTEQRDQFASRMAGQFEVFSFEAPHLAADEREEFLEWYKARTGRTATLEDVTTQNTLLVLFMFELAKGMRLPEFARRFRRRLERLGLFEAVRTVLAVNALYMGAPAELLEDDAKRDALERLCQDDQMHFSIGSEDEAGRRRGIRLEHAHLAWLLFVEWVEPPTTLGKAWGRELGKALHVLVSRSMFAAANRLLYHVLNTGHAGDVGRSEDADPVADRREVIGELYRVHVTDCGGRTEARCLSRWLEMEHKVAGLTLKPDLVVIAGAALADDGVAEFLPASVAAWVWLMAGSRPQGQAGHLRESAERFFHRFNNAAGVGYELTRILAQSRGDSAALSLVSRWLEANPTHPQAYELLAPMVAANPADPEIRARALNWMQGNPNHPQEYWLLAPLVAANPADPEIRTRAMNWLHGNENHPQVQHLLKTAIARSDGDDAWLARGEVYLRKPGCQHPEHIIAVLISAGKARARFLDMALEYMNGDIAKGPRGFLLYHLGRALIRNGANAVDYLRGCESEEWARDVCRGIAWAIKRSEEGVAAFVREALPKLSADQTYWILRDAVRYGAECDELGAVLAQWLIGNHWQRGYGGMMELLATRPAQWKRVLALGVLPRTIVDDYAARSG